MAEVLEEKFATSLNSCSEHSLLLLFIIIIIELYNTVGGEDR